MTERRAKGMILAIGVTVPYFFTTLIKDYGH
jgi:hypothetical protein